MAGPGASDTIVVITGGDPVTVDERARVPADALVIAADSGIEHAQALGLRVDVAVGDFDSVSADALHRAEAQGAVLERHPAAKDATDLELALDAAVRRGAGRIVVLGGHGGRVDHLLARYGARVDDLLALVDARPELAEPLEGAEDHLAAEIVYAVTHEAARHLDDVLTRRTRISIETFDRGVAAATPAALLMGVELGWDEARIEDEVDH